ncbi:unnamed protein product [Fraxinus pennsylvanica]|uniref:Uncharacterized protein n=1 Tax=Fraxinus pennsylvanica TaxID=56036 RepID=A0AAD1ZXH3_9LAMI|nr:unnamed protein product [Fraxinus pennsylvanica]
MDELQFAMLSKPNWTGKDDSFRKTGNSSTNRLGFGLKPLKLKIGKKPGQMSGPAAKLFDLALVLPGYDDNNTVHSGQDSDNDGDREVNPLVVPLIENAPSQEEIAPKWLSQNVFMDADEREDLENDDSEDEM